MHRATACQSFGFASRPGNGEPSMNVCFKQKVAKLVHFRSRSLKSSFEPRCSRHPSDILSKAVDPGQRGFRPIRSPWATQSTPGSNRHFRFTRPKFLRCFFSLSSQSRKSASGLPRPPKPVLPALPCSGRPAGSGVCCATAPKCARSRRTSGSRKTLA
jgi:hypothetical protein